MDPSGKGSSGNHFSTCLQPRQRNTRKNSSDAVVGESSSARGTSNQGEKSRVSKAFFPTSPRCPGLRIHWCCLQLLSVPLRLCSNASHHGTCFWMVIRTSF